MQESKIILGKPLDTWIKEFPIIDDLIKSNETIWINENKLPFSDAIKKSQLTKSDIEDASKRLQRFASYFKKVFPETAKDGGLIESPLKSIPNAQKAMEEKYRVTINGDLMIKLDSHLAISGSIKARGGIYEVLWALCS